MLNLYEIEAEMRARKNKLKRVSRNHWKRIKEKQSAESGFSLPRSQRVRECVEC